MERQRQPAMHLADGLRRLVRDISQPDPLPGHGLSGITCGETRLISFDDDGVRFCQHGVEKLVAENTFDEVTWLLLNGELPGEEYLADIQAIVSDSAVIDNGAAEMLERIPLNVRPLDLFPLSISLVSFFDPMPPDQKAEATRHRVWRLLAQLPVMLAAGLGHRLDHGRIDDGELSATTWAGRLLYCLRNEASIPTPAEDAAMNAVMICCCLTEMRPACFAARFAGSTVNHIVAALQAASTLFVSQLNNDPFQWTSDLLRSLSGPSAAEAWWRRREGQPMPFGFSSENSDPRPAILQTVCRGLLGSHDRIRIEASACRLEKIQAAQQLFPTTDWVAARVLTLLNIPSDRHALVIAMSRLVGWAAQAIEQQKAGVSLLPALRYETCDDE
jgi:citrate synthase